MLTSDGPVVLEFNVRMGDPETEAVLPLLQSDLYEGNECIYIHILNVITVLHRCKCDVCRCSTATTTV
jgi:phosphoribosylamine-glycine ligase